jgi:hypothetical protein
MLHQPCLQTHCVPYKDFYLFFNNFLKSTTLLSYLAKQKYFYHETRHIKTFQEKVIDDTIVVTSSHIKAFEEKKNAAPFIHISKE